MKSSVRNLEAIRRKLNRKCIGFDVGGFRPDDDPSSSWFGRVLLGAKGDEWPISNGKPMLPLAQINLEKLPFKPTGLENLSFLSIFIDSENLPISTPNGLGWKVFSYKSQALLTPLTQPITTSNIRPFPMKAKIIEEDFPCWEDVEIELPDDVHENYYDLFENANGIKLGGWPSLIQSEIFWAPYNQHPAKPKYLFQIDSVPKSGWGWADGGVGYFGRGTESSSLNEWVMEWQCY